MTPRTRLLLAAALLSTVACGPPPSPTTACPDHRPDGFDEPCESDQTCASYLICRRNRCALPPTMNGQPESTTRDVTFRPAGDDGAELMRLQVETASSAAERNEGLAGRPCMLEGWGMLFVHPDPSELTYSTADLEVAIDLAFFDASGRLVSIYRDVPPGRETISSGRDAQYVIEASAGALQPLHLEDTAEWDPIE